MAKTSLRKKVGKSIQKTAKKALLKNGFTKDNIATNKLVIQGKLPKSQLEVVPQKKKQVAKKATPKMTQAQRAASDKRIAKAKKDLTKAKVKQKVRTTVANVAKTAKKIKAEAKRSKAPKKPLKSVIRRKGKAFAVPPKG